MKSLFFAFLLFTINLLCAQQSDSLSVNNTNDSALVKTAPNSLKLKSDYYSNQVVSVDSVKNHKRPIGATFALEAILGPAIGSAFALLAALIGGSIAKSGNSGYINFSGVYFGYAAFLIGTGTGTYFISKRGYEKSSFWISSAGSVAGAFAGAGIASLFKSGNRPYALTLALGPILGAIIFNHFYGISN